VTVVFCAVLGFIQEYRAKCSLAVFQKMLSPVSAVLRGGKEEEIPSQKLFPGDGDEHKTRGGDGGELCAARGKEKGMSLIM
jgi:hypothetical protein